MGDRTSHGGELPGLTPERIDVLAGSWSGQAVWGDVRWLAGQFWAAADPADRRVRWHHLVLAVGNFKRQGGRRLQPPSLTGLSNEAFAVCDEFESPDGPRVAMEDARSWSALTEHLSGSGVATTTTLLAALWPDRHFVFDWRVRAAVSGIRIAALLPPCPTVQRAREGEKLAPITFEDYELVREWLATTGRRLTQTERALYELSRRVPTQTNRTWDEYASTAKRQLERIDTPP